MQQIHCISYAAKRFIPRKTTFIEQAKNFNQFHSIQVYGYEDLDDIFCQQYKNVLNLDRGAGYWIWKPQIVKQHLNKINKDDILFYIDAGCSFNFNQETYSTFLNYIDIINNNSFLRFSVEMPEKDWSNHKCITFFSDKYNVSYDYLANSEQLIGTVIGFKKDLKTEQFLNECFACLETDPDLITDQYNEINKQNGFNDHRHDQSILSLLYKALGYTHFLPNHTWPPTPFQNKISPFLATRLCF